MLLPPIVESKVVSLYENLPQLPERLSELTSFPFIKNDDFVDAFTYGVTVYRDEIMGGRPVHGGERGRLPRMVHDPSFQGGSRRTSSDIGLIGANRGASSTTTKYL